MLAFVSVVSAYRVQNPIIYPDIHGKEYISIQTNESAVVFAERKNPLSKIFLIATNAVKNNFAPAENEFGEVTHLNFLKRRLLKEFPQLEEKFFEIDYSDDVGLEKNILQVAEISDVIQNYAKSFPKEKLKVHVDMTGGFRYASMLMLSIIQLLKYRGIEIGDVLYSDPDNKTVYRLNEIQNIFTLITGADEFVKFGSVDALIEYFENASDSSTDKLIRAMKRFSETIKICRTSTLEDDLKNLVAQIKIFRESRDENLKSQLFAKIIDTVEEGYGKLVKGEESRLEIIRWCLEKGFWQQAMTLCTEWLPGEIVDRGIFKPKDSEVIESVKSESRSFGCSWKQDLIIHWQGKIKNRDAKIGAFCKNFREQLLNFSLAEELNLIDIKSYGRFENFLSEYKTGANDFKLYQSNKLKLKTFAEKFPVLYSAWKIVYEKNIVKNSYQKNFGLFLKEVDAQEIFSFLAKLSGKNLLEFFQIPEENILSREEESFDRIARNKWKNREEKYIFMLDSGLVESIFDREKTLEILKGFYDIRNERNSINHALSNERKEIFKLRQMIENYLLKLEKIGG